MTKVVHVKKTPCDVYIGRPSKWGNPFSIGKDGSREEVIKKYREWIITQPRLLRLIVPELKDKTLGCWCLKEPVDFIRKNKRCHGEVLLELAETFGRKSRRS